MAHGAKIIASMGWKKKNPTDGFGIVHKDKMKFISLLSRSLTLRGFITNANA
jgi:hypothetical protein